jgi:hypothetical protein
VVLLGIATAALEPANARSQLGGRALLVLFAMAALMAVHASIGAAGERAAISRKTAESRLAALQPLVERHPYLENARRQRALAWTVLAYRSDGYEKTRLSRAARDLERVLETRPWWGEAHADLAWVKYVEGKPSEARREMEKATQYDPTHIGVGIASAQLFVWSGDTPSAISELVRLRKLNPLWSRERAREIAAAWTSDTKLLAEIP